jgi:hypothetical protein
MRTRSELYQFHCENLREVSRGIERIQLAARHAIAVQDDYTLSALIRLHGLLLGTWAECRLKKLLYEKSGFTDSERTQIRTMENQYQRWTKTVDLAFRKHFDLSDAAINATTIPFSAAARHAECLRLLKDELRPVIELRNKLAHGQWVYLLNSSEDEVNASQIAALKKENLLTLQFKRDLIDHIAKLINDLVVSVSFDRDFDTHYRQIADTSARLKTQNYANYAVRLQQRRAHGTMSRKQNDKTAIRHSSGQDC